MVAKEGCEEVYEYPSMEAEVRDVMAEAIVCIIADAKTIRTRRASRPVSATVDGQGYVKVSYDKPGRAFLFVREGERLYRVSVKVTEAGIEALRRPKRVAARDD
jgi:hypothetical protein